MSLSLSRKPHTRSLSLATLSRSRFLFKHNSLWLSRSFFGTPSRTWDFLKFHLPGLKSASFNCAGIELNIFTKWTNQQKRYKIITSIKHRNNSLRKRCEQNLSTQEEGEKLLKAAEDGNLYSVITLLKVCITNVHFNIYQHISIWYYTYIYIYTYVHIYICIDAYMYVHIDIYLYTLINVYVCVCVCVNKPPYTHNFIHPKTSHLNWQPESIHDCINQQFLLLESRSNACLYRYMYVMYGEYA